MWKRIGGPLLWPLREKDMAKLLNAITQQKSTIALALAVDHMYRRVESHTTKLSSIANIVASSRNYSTEMRAEIALVWNTQRGNSST
jgi:hypothetical protein